MQYTWICWYVNDYSDVINVIIDGTPYSGTASYLASTYPDVFELGVSDNGDKALMAKSGTTPVTAVVDGIAQDSTVCEIVGGHPKPPNK